MKLSRRANLRLMAATALAMAVPVTLRASGTTHEVLMLNAHPENKRERMVFLPDVLRVQPGDTVKFISTDKGHNTAADVEDIPEGAEEWDSKIGDDFEISLMTEGAYAYYCKPHKSTGMVGLILVGDVSSNYEAVKSANRRPRNVAKRYEAIFAKADELLAGES